MSEFVGEYVCEACHQTFRKGRTEADANAEAEALFGVAQASTREDMVRVCDDCFKAIMQFRQWE